MNDIVTIEDKIASKIDTKVAGALVVSDKAGGMTFTNAGEVMEFAKMLSISQGAVPKHLRGNPGVCLGIVMQAIEWRMSPFAVANKSYVVNDKLAFEAQLIHAVAIQRAPIEGRIKFEFTGEGQTRKCRAWAIIAGASRRENAEVVDYTSPSVGEIKVKNSPLWLSDPDQQLTYYSVRALCRRHFPDVLMGIFAPDEFDTNGSRARDVTPHEPLQQYGKTAATLTEKLDAIASHQNVMTGPVYPNMRNPEAPPEINVPEVPEPFYAESARAESTEMNTPPPDDKKPLLIATAMVKAAEGSKPFTRWLSALSLPDYDRLGKSLPELNKVAAAADRRNTP